MFVFEMSSELVNLADVVMVMSVCPLLSITLQKTHRTQTDQCFHMLMTWNEMYPSSSAVDRHSKLTEVLQLLGYTQAVGFLQVRDRQQLLK